MNNDRKQLIPDLRFPEFVDDKTWAQKAINDIAISQSSSVALNKLILKDSGFPVYGADSIVGYIDKFQQKDIYVSIVKDGSGVGRLNLCVKESSVLGTLAYIKSKDAEEYNIIWIYYLLNTIDFTKYIKGAGIPHIYFTDFKEERIAVPTPKEQQKIASCLSSLDQLITAQKEKLELLKNHKKGLMQNLFPQEGETVPKFRFPEFENDGDWEEKKLGDITENVMYGMNASAIRYDGENKYIRITDIDENSRTFLQNSLTSPNGQLEEKYILKIGDLLFARTGASVGKSYLHQKENGKIYFAGFLIRLTIKNEIPYFIYAQTLTDQYFKWVIKTSMRSGQPGLNAEEYKSYRVFIPPSINEQEKIVSGLSSLDELISSEKERLEKLQLHKKGLMQGLFPKMID